MAYTRSRNLKPVTIQWKNLTSGKTGNQLGHARPHRGSIIPQHGLPDTMYFHRVRVDSEAARKNILRLFFQDGSIPENFASQYKNPEDTPEYRSLVKLGVCWKLSASSPRTCERAFTLPEALDGLCTCLRAVIKGENPNTKAQDDYVCRIEGQLKAITALSDFVMLSSEALYKKFLDVFIPEDSSTQKEILKYLQSTAMYPARGDLSFTSPYPTRGGLPFKPPYPTWEETSVHLSCTFTDNQSCYSYDHENSDFSRDVSLLITECLKFPHEDTYAYWVGKAPR